MVPHYEVGQIKVYSLLGSVRHPPLQTRSLTLLKVCISRYIQTDPHVVLFPVPRDANVW